MGVLGKITGSDKVPDAPDLGASAAAADDIARLNQDAAATQLEWARGQVEQNRGLFEQVVQPMLSAQSEAAGAGADARSRFTGTFQPLEDDLIGDYQDYASPARMEREVGAAVADVGASFDAQRENALRRLESYGVDPSQTRSAALDVGVRTAQAAAQAQAARQARQGVEDTARGLRGQALEYGASVYPNMALANTQQALDAGQSAISAGLNTAQVNAALPSTASQPFSQTALQGYQQGAQTRLGQFDAALSSAQAREAAFTGRVGMITDMIPVTAAARAVGGAGVADGGAIRRAALPGGYNASGGVVVDPSGRSDGSGIDDRVPVNVSTDEYIVPADVVRIKGTEFFDKLVQKYHTSAADQRGAALAGAY